MALSGTLTGVMKDSVSNALQGATQQVGASLVSTVLEPSSKSISSSTYHKFNDDVVVILNEKNRKILGIFNITIDELKLTNPSALAVSAAHTRSGIIKKFFAFIENFSNKNLSAKECSIPKVKQVEELNPSEPERLLLKNYYVFLAALMEKQKLNAAEIDEQEQKGITSPYVLFYELLVLLFSTALDGRTSDEDRDLIVKAIKIFVDKVNCWTDVLHSTGLSGLFSKNSLSSVNKSLSSEHDEWVRLLDDMVTSKKVLKMHEAAIRSSKDYLEKAEQAILLQLIAEFNAGLELGFLDHRFIENTVSQQEERLKSKESGKAAVIREDSNGVIINSIGENEKSKFSVQCKPKTKKEHVKALYELLDRTRILRQVISNLECLNTSVGWVFIVSGILKLENIASLFVKHSRESALVLDYDDSSSFYKEKIATGFLRYDKSKELSQIAKISFGKLQGLNDHRLLETIMFLVEQSVLGLIECGKVFGYELIDEQRFMQVSNRALPLMIKSNAGSLARVSYEAGSSRVSRASSLDTPYSLSAAPSRRETKISIFEEGPAFAGAIPKRFKCSMTGKLMTDPVILNATGKVYERSAIETHLNLHGTIPGTETFLFGKERELTPDRQLLEDIQEFHNIEASRKIALIANIAKAALLPEQVRYRDEYSKFDFSKRKFSEEQRQQLEKRLADELSKEANLREKEFDWILQCQNQIQRALSIHIALKVNPERQMLLRDKEDKVQLGSRVTEPFGVVLRNGAGASDFDIILATLSERVSMAIRRVEKEVAPPQLDAPRLVPKGSACLIL